MVNSNNKVKIILFFILAASFFGIFEGIFEQKIIGGQKIEFVQYTGKPVCGASTCGWWLKCEKGLVASKTVTIGDYKIIVSQDYRYCKNRGGWGILYGYKIYKNGELIKEVPLNCEDGLKAWKREKFDNLEIDFRDDYWSSYYTLWALQNIYRFKLPENAFEFIIYSPEEHYFQGENVTVNVIVKNNLNYSAFAKIKTKICQPTVWGKACHEFINKKYLNPGKNTLTYSVPTKYVVDKLEVTPELELWVDLSKINIDGLNINKWKIYNENGKRCGDDYSLRKYKCSLVSVKYCIDRGYKFYKLGNFKGNTTTIMISPKPLYIEVGKDKICPPGYHLSPNELYCIRDDLKELSCLKLGCPVIPNHTYICTSAGICAEIVYVYQDCRQLGCPEIEGAVNSYCDTKTGVCIYEFENKTIIEKKITCKEDPNICPPGTICDKNTGACIRKELVEKLIQCNVDSDCYIPCEGVTAKCVNNYCDYSGSCKPTYIYINKTVVHQITCKDNPELCPPGTYCDMNTGLCIRKEIVYKELGCKELGGDKACPDGYYCDEERNVCVRQLTYIEKIISDIKRYKNTILLTSILIIIGVILWKIKKR